MSVGTDAADLSAERGARALLRHGSVREALTLLRAAVARDPEEEDCARLLDGVTAGQASDDASVETELTLGVVDRWIRRGMLVEALALLGGTPMGSDETGREWANLLGELLAPVPVDAEATLAEMHRQLVTGGASVALTLLEERARRPPALPAWAERRLALLRWMLLDNADAAEPHRTPSGASTALAAAIRDALGRGSVRELREVARSFAAADPTDPEPAALGRAVDAMLAEAERNAEDVGPRARTLPLLGHPAACMQLRMANLEQACSVYRKILRHDPADALATRMLAVVESILRASRGEPMDDAWGGETSREPLRQFHDEPTEEMGATEPGDEGSGVVVRRIRSVE